MNIWPGVIARQYWSSLQMLLYVEAYLPTCKTQHAQSYSSRTGGATSAAKMGYA